MAEFHITINFNPKADCSVWNYIVPGKITNFKENLNSQYCTGTHKFAQGPSIPALDFFELCKRELVAKLKPAPAAGDAVTACLFFFLIGGGGGPPEE
jgi:hypothetical protein